MCSMFPLNSSSDFRRKHIFYEISCLNNPVALSSYSFIIPLSSPKYPIKSSSWIFLFLHSPNESELLAGSMPFRFANHWSPRAVSKPHSSASRTSWPFSDSLTILTRARPQHPHGFCFWSPFPPTCLCHPVSFLKLELDPRLPRMAHKTLPEAIPAFQPQILRGPPASSLT